MPKAVLYFILYSILYTLYDGSAWGRGGARDYCFLCQDHNDHHPHHLHDDQPILGDVLAMLLLCAFFSATFPLRVEQLESEAGPSKLEEEASF